MEFLTEPTQLKSVEHAEKILLSAITDKKSNPHTGEIPIT